MPSLSRFLSTALSASLVFHLSIALAAAGDWHVAAGATGNGTAAAPYGRIQDALNVAQPGDTIQIAPGTYSESLRTVRSGTAAQRVILRAFGGRGSVLVTAPGRVLTVAHAYHTLDGLVLDGQYGASDLLRVETSGHGFVLRNSEVRRTSRDGIDMGAPSDVLIDNSLIHHTLNATDGRTDAHGIVAGAARRLTIRNTEVHTFSGDAFQIDPGRSTAGWDDVLIENCRFWLQPLPAPENGFAAGVVPGENAVDTKVGSTFRPKLTIRNTEAFGYRSGVIGNMAAFNIKENVDVVIDRVTVHSSEIAFRLRAPALVRVQNAVVHTVTTGVRYEDGIQGLRLFNSTFGSGITRVFQSASSSGSVLDVRNVAILGTTLPGEANASSNLALPATAFVDVSRHNYQLSSASAALDAGVSLAEVATDRQGTTRPQGTAYDVGAFEKVVTTTTPEPSGDAEVVLYAWRALIIAGNWQVVSDPAAAGGARISSSNLGAGRVRKPQTAPADYFELTFHAEAGRPYRLWMRGIAASNHVANDSVFVQFDQSVTETGAATYRIGSQSAATVNLEECTRCGLDGWGWQDNGSGVNVLGPAIYFATSGLQRVRVQTREDGFSIDQIVVSPSAYLTMAPGLNKGDTTVLPEIP